LLRYSLGPTALSAYLPTPGARRLTVSWQGSVDADVLETLFWRAAPLAGRGAPSASRALLVTQDGLLEVTLAEGKGLPVGLLGSATYVRLECLASPHGVLQPGDAEPEVAVWANLDPEADSLDDLQQSVGIDLRAGDLAALSEDIARTAAHTRSGFFPPGYANDFLAVLGRLGDLRADVAEAGARQASA
jgi:hypothetical protein